MSSVLIDDLGDMWPANPQVLARRFDRLRMRSDFIHQAISFGFISVRFCESGPSIALRPQFASRLAVSCAFDLIARQNPARVALAHNAQMSSWEIIIGADRAISRIAQLVAESRSPSPRLLRTAQRLRVEHSPDIAGGRLLPLLQAWHQTRGRWDTNLYGRLQEDGLLAGTIIARLSRGSERLLVEYWGEKLTRYGRDWTRIARGRDFEDQPDTEIGQSTAAMHRQTIAEGGPVLTASDLVYRGINGELARLTFYRSDLPWWTPDGATIVTAVTAKRRVIVLERATRWIDPWGARMTFGLPPSPAVRGRIS